MTHEHEVLTAQEILELEALCEWAKASLVFGSVGMTIGADGKKEVYSYIRGKRRYFTPTGEMTEESLVAHNGASEDLDKMKSLAEGLPRALATIRAQGKRIEELEGLETLVVKCYETIEDFMPNIGKCALRDYQRLNEALCEAGKIAKARAALTPPSTDSPEAEEVRG